MIITDSHFQIGHTHYICEDYALAGASKDGSFHYAIVSDGCSSSNDTDIGARILSKCAVDAINLIIPNSSGDANELHDIIGDVTIKNAQRVIRSLGLPDNALDATLIIAITENNETTVLFYGDGAAFISYGDDISGYVSVEYPENAPYYLSYRLDEDRHTNYLKECKEGFNVRKAWLKGFATSSSFESHNLDEKIVPTFSDIKLVAVMSDGIETFHDKNRIDTEISIAEITNFKNYTGEFVKRRMVAMKRRNDKVGIAHDDDISMAAIYYKKDEE